MNYKSKQTTNEHIIDWWRRGSSNKQKNVELKANIKNTRWKKKIWRWNLIRDGEGRKNKNQCNKRGENKNETRIAKRNKDYYISWTKSRFSSKTNHESILFIVDRFLLQMCWWFRNHLKFIIMNEFDVYVFIRLCVWSWTPRFNIIIRNCSHVFVMYRRGNICITVEALSVLQFRLHIKKKEWTKSVSPLYSRCREIQ